MMLETDVDQVELQHSAGVKIVARAAGLEVAKGRKLRQKRKSLKEANGDEDLSYAKPGQVP
jgi:hypothetical protein